MRVDDLGTPKPPIPAGISVRGPAEHHLGAQLLEQVDVRAHHPAVLEVADDGHLEPLEAALVLADGEGVEQRLGGVLVGAVAGVDDARLQARWPACAARRGGRGG